MRRCAVALALLFAACWLAFLRPTSLGGPMTYVIVSGESMLPSLHSGDLVLAVESRSYRQGDIAVFRVPRGQTGGGTPVIHRIVGGSAGGGFVLQGDNREFRDPWQPTAAEIEGRTVLTVPRLGLLLVFLRSPMGLAAAAGLFAFLLVGGNGTRRRPRPTVLGRA